MKGGSDVSDRAAGQYGSVGKIAFADQLRGVAALMVVAAHFFLSFWRQSGAVAAAIAAPLASQENGISGWAFWDYVNPGPFGVALFFLISGFVIPFSLGRYSGVAFLLARAIRIYPTYIACLAISTLTILFNASWWNGAVHFTPMQWLANALLLNDLTAAPSIDLVNWTLVVEMRFYLVMAVIAGAIRTSNVSVVFTVAFICAAFNAAWHFELLGDIKKTHYVTLAQIAVSAQCIIFMLIGTLVQFHCRGSLRNDRAMTLIALMALLFLGTWRFGVWAEHFWRIPMNYIFALAVFLVSYALRERFKPVPLLNWLARISYPLYAVHSIVGWTVMQVSVSVFGAPALVAALIAFLVVFLVATGIHWLAERPTIESGRAVAAAMS